MQQSRNTDETNFPAGKDTSGRALLVLGLLPEKLRGLLRFGTSLGSHRHCRYVYPECRAQSQAGTQSSCSRSPVVDARPDFGASSVMYPDRPPSSNNVPVPFVFIMGFLQTPVEPRDPSGPSARRRDLLLGKACFGA